MQHASRLAEGVAGYVEGVSNDRFGFMVEMETPLLSASSACDMFCFRRTVFILVAILLQSSMSVSMYILSNMSNLIFIAANTRIKVHG